MSIDYDDRRWDRILHDRFVYNRFLDNKFRERVQENERREKERKERADAELRSREKARWQQLWQQYKKAADAEDFDGARRALDVLLTHDPHNPDLHLFRGICFLKLELYDVALAIFNKSLVPFILNREQTVARWFWLGRTYYAKGDFIRAEIEFDAVLRGERKHPSAHYWRAHCRMDRGRYKEAIADFTTALTIDPGYPKSLYYRGLCHIKIGDSVQGRRDLHRAIELFTKEADEEGVRLAREALDSERQLCEKPPKTSAILHPAPTTAPPFSAPMAGAAHALPIWQHHLLKDPSLEVDVDDLLKLKDSSLAVVAGHFRKDPSFKVDVDHLLNDPSLSSVEKCLRLTDSTMKKMNQVIERQAQYIHSFQQQSSPGQSIDVETMKLKRLIDKRSQMFDDMRQIVDTYNQKTRDIIIDSISVKKSDKP